jgi:glycosyltransferase involved in cell wall biosynthesis
MRIVYVISYYKPAYSYGGPVRSVSALCEAMARVGADVCVLTTNANRPEQLKVPLSQPVDVNGVQVWYFPLMARGLKYFFSPQMVSAVQRHVPGADIVVAEVMWGHAIGAVMRASKDSGVPYVVPLRGQLMPWALKHHRWKKIPFFWLLGKRYLNEAAALHCTDQSEAELIKHLKLRTPVFVVPNGIDLQRFRVLPERGALRHRLQIPLDANVLLFLGRLNPIKRPDIAIEALASVSPQHGQPHLILAGPDESQLIPGLQAQAVSLGCERRVHFTGLLEGDEVLQALADADLVVMPSEVQENFGMTAVEALAAGVPILVSDRIPVGRWAVAAGAGVSVPNTPLAFSTALSGLLAAPTELKQMGECGRHLAQEHFDIQAVARNMLGQFRAIITTGHPLALD